MHASKPNLLDAMNILLKVWNRQDKYSTEDGIMRCWLQANCLPTPMQAELQALVHPGRNRIAQHRLPDMELNALRSSMLALRASVEKLGDVPSALDESYSDARSDNVSQEELREMMEMWCSIEDQPDAINQEVEEAIEELEQPNTTLTADDNSDQSDADDDGDGAASIMSDTVSTHSGSSESAPSLSLKEFNDCFDLLAKLKKDGSMSKECRRLAYSLETQLHADLLKRRARQSSLRSYFDTK